MIMTDPTTDILTRARNTLQARRETMEIPANKEKVEIAKVLRDEGFITDCTVSGDVEKAITVTLRYSPSNEKVINGLKRISKPGLRVYARVDSIPRVVNGLGIAIISASHGVITGREAEAKRVGSEVIAYVW